MSREPPVRRERSSQLELIVVFLLLAMIISPIIRQTTAELNRSLGTTWPFAFAHCRVVTTPGCDRTDPMLPASNRLGWR